MSRSPPTTTFSALLCQLDVAVHLLEVLLLDKRSHERVGPLRISDDEFGGLGGEPLEELFANRVLDQKPRAR